MPSHFPPLDIEPAPYTGHLNRMTEVWRYGLHPTGGYLQLNDLVYNVYGDANRPGRLTNSWEYNSHGGRGYRGGYNGSPIQYDAAGDLLRIASETFTYSPEVQCATTISIAGQATTNHYTRAGKKLAYTTPTGQRYAQYEKLEFYQGQAYRYYTDDGYYDFVTGRWVYHIKDYLGTPRVTFSDVNGDDVITPSTEILEERTLYPFGLYAFGRTANGFTGDKRDFTGHEFVGRANQRQQGVVDMLARVYLPGVGVFGSVDPMADLEPGLTPYRYAFNDPINYTDPDGLFESKAEAREYAKEHGIKTGLFRNSKIEYDKDGKDYAIVNKTERSVIQKYDGQVVTGGMALEQNSVSMGPILVGAATTSQLDSPAPGPADVVAAGIIVVGTGMWLESLLPVTSPDFSMPDVMLSPTTVYSKRARGNHKSDEFDRHTDDEIDSMYRELSGRLSKDQKKLKQKLQLEQKARTSRNKQSKGSEKGTGSGRS